MYRMTYARFLRTTTEPLCIQRGTTEKELEEPPESTVTAAYGANATDIELSKAIPSGLNMALTACLLRYGEVGPWLADE